MSPFAKSDAAGGPRGVLLTSSRNIGSAGEGGGIAKPLSWIELRVSAVGKSQRLDVNPEMQRETQSVCIVFVLELVPDLYVALCSFFRVLKLKCRH